ncbi:hypothetical protein EYC80_002873 [Monilinia laxa]|uniref:Uncharacterized protein n=1 Tax=Monilinia laxa TaxID=61186 RepID=A0A5N6KC07_MONLA|nr:hypothetical protein EYC80_002873 [Monilinia laxa]
MSQIFTSPWHYVALVLAVATILSLSIAVVMQSYDLVWLVRLRLREQHELRLWRGAEEGAVGNGGVREGGGEEREEQEGEGERGEEGGEERGVREGEEREGGGREEEAAGARNLPSAE